MHLGPAGRQPGRGPKHDCRARDWDNGGVLAGHPTSPGSPGRLSIPSILATDLIASDDQMSRPLLDS